MPLRKNKIHDKKRFAKSEFIDLVDRFFSVPSMVQFLSGVSPDTGIYRQV